ncbi:MAG: hypothetical protein JWL77_6491 [Chthonomonadaceae bacterium]|nr:hypothetical protein [Chthonomonadaceae bacterium]
MAEKRPLPISKEVDTAIEYLVSTQSAPVRPSKKVPGEVSPRSNRSRLATDVVRQVSYVVGTPKKEEAPESMNVCVPSITHLAGKYEGEEWDELLEEIKRNRQAGLENELAE